MTSDPQDSLNLLNSITRSTQVSIGIKPLPLTSALVKSDYNLVQNLTSLGYDKVILPITNNRYKENCKSYFKQFKESHKINNLSDLNVSHPTLNEVNILTGPHIYKSTVGLLSSWIELDSDDNLINEFSFQVLNNEVSYAKFVGLTTLLIAPPIDLTHLPVFTSNLNTILYRYPSITISISLPICEEVQINSKGELIPIIDHLSTWDMWNTIRIQCNYPKNLTVSLGSPKQNIPEYVVNRWLIEPIQFYLISASRFIPNSKNYPVLNKFNQLIIWKYIQKKCHNPPTLLLHGVDKKDNEIISSLRNSLIDEVYEPPNGTGIITVDGNQVYLGDLSYLNYLKHLISLSSHNNQLTSIENFTLNNCSTTVLQSPLEPHSANLSNLMYKVFEQDNVKYDCYERAIISALMDLINERFHHVKNQSNVGVHAFKTSQIPLTPTHVEYPPLPNIQEVPDEIVSPQRQSNHPNLKILIVGPGRGPLIEKLFNAMKLLNLNLDKIQITAIEKNSNVMIYLNQRNQEFWSNKVKIINEDVRFWKPSLDQDNGFNLIVSELLGSFGCNELAPEILFSLEKFGDPNRCVFIPQDFTTSVTPIISPSIYRKLLDNSDSNKFNKLYIPTIEEFDTQSKPSKLWSFNFPNASTSISNNNRGNKRQVQTTLKCRRKGTIHGLLGFFTATLYKSVTISNNPQQPVPANLISWLPCFFPLDNPITITDDQELSIFIKRDTDGSRVWYEWSLECFIYLVLPLEKTVSRNGSVTNRNSVGTAASVGNDDGFMHEPRPFQEEYQVRVRTDVSKVHNVNGQGFSFPL